MFYHLQDMVAFSCCVYDGREQEQRDMQSARERGWKGKFTKPGLIIHPEFNRINGRCPLTPLEVIVSLTLFILIFKIRRDIHVKYSLHLGSILVLLVARSFKAYWKSLFCFVTFMSLHSVRNTPPIFLVGPKPG